MTTLGWLSLRPGVGEPRPRRSPAAASPSKVRPLCGRDDFRRVYLAARRREAAAAHVARGGQVTICGAGYPVRRAPVAQRKSIGLLIRRSGVRILPGAWRTKGLRASLTRLQGFLQGFRRDSGVGGLIVHIARKAEWQQAKGVGEYVPSTLPHEGFIHLSRPEQVHLPANAMYSGQRDLILLWVEPTRLRADLRYEAPEPGAPEFPHLYGPLNLDAVVAETHLEPWERGAFRLPGAFPDIR
jgi:uncharacterized protein (DUF952 family)